jgi:hypothetical protein
VLLEPEWRTEDGPRVLDELDLSGDFVEVRFAVEAVKRLLGVEQFHLARPAVHEQVDDGLGPGREVRRPRLEVGGVRAVGPEFAAEQVEEGGPTKAGGDAAEEGAAGREQVGHFSLRIGTRPNS